ncbi:DUF3883 domain-containing protein [Lutispora sp.]|uniref:DUF3883 domain-containing protein n=1 Tax=Lutispora sp. TaxID=2828727 RepID=UPI0035688A32
MQQDEFTYLTFYNSEIKKKFLIEEYKTPSTRKTASYSLQKYWPYEKNHAHKDISLFNKNDFTSLFKNHLKPDTPNALSVHISTIKKYQQWYSKEYNTPLTFDVSKFTEEEKNFLLFSKIQYLKKEDIYKILDNPKHDIRGKAVIFLIYEGIIGEECKEIRFLKIEQLSYNSISIVGEKSRTIIVPTQLIDILHQVNDSIEMEKTFNPNSKTNKLPLKDNGHIFKKGTRRNLSEVISYNRLGRIVHEILTDYLGKEIKKPINFIEKSGKLDYFKRLRSELLFDSDKVERHVFEKLCYRYGENKSQWNPLKKLLIRIDDNQNLDNDYEHTQIIYSILKSTPVNFTNEDKQNSKEDDNENINAPDGTDDENKQTPDWLDVRSNLGRFGEKLAEQILLSSYKAIQDVSRRCYLGYDFKVFDHLNNSYYFEIKTTCSKHFFISANELKVADSHKNKYYILLIQVDNKNKIIRYTKFNNPVIFFNLDYASLTSSIEIGHSSYISSSSFCVDINPELLNECECEIISFEMIDKCRSELSKLTAFNKSNTKWLRKNK